MSKAIANANPGQTIGFRKSPQCNHIIIPVTHGVGIVGRILGKFVISFIQNDKDPFWYVCVEFIKFLPGDSGTHGIIRISDINDLGVIGDLGCHGFQIVAVVFHGNPMDAPAGRIGQNAKSNKGIGSANQFIITQ